MCGHAFSCCRSLFLCYDSIKVQRCDAPAPHIDKGSHDSPYHVAQKAVGSNDKMPLCGAVLHPSGFGDMAKGCPYISMAFAKCAEIADGKQKGRGLVHQLEVQGIAYLAGAMAKKRIFTGMYIIIIGTRTGTETGMHFAVYGFYLADGNVGGQNAVKPIGKLVGIKVRMEIEVRHHLPGMNSSIGTPRPHHLDGLAQNSAHGLLQHFLHRTC